MAIYKNIGVLDLRKASEAVLSGVTQIESVGMIICLESQSSLIAKIRQNAIGSIIAVPENVQLIMHNGEYTVDTAFLESQNAQVMFVINGLVKVEALISQELADKIHKIFVNGRIVASEESFKYIGSKIQINGENVLLKNDEIYVEGTFELDEMSLMGLDNQSMLVVNGLKCVHTLPEEDFHEKIKSIRILNDLVADRETMKKIAPKIKDFIKLKKIIVPEGYAFFDQLKLTDEKIDFLKEENLFVKGKLKITCTAEKLKEKIMNIQANQIEITKETYDEIKPIIKAVEKLKIIDPNVMENMNHLLLDSDYLNGSSDLSLRNYGKLTLKKDITKELFQEKFKAIENYGLIQCPAELHQALMEKVNPNYGMVIQTKEKESLSEDEVVIGSLGYLEL